MNGNDILGLGVPRGPLVGLALQVAREHSLDRVRQAFQDPDLAAPDDDVTVREFKQAVQAFAKQAQAYTSDLRDTAVPIRTWGREIIDPNAMRQMVTAARLPNALAAALLPDAHLGYGLPIGGVLAMDNAVIPNAVGVDIGCSVHLTMYRNQPLTMDAAVGALRQRTFFGLEEPTRFDGFNPQAVDSVLAMLPERFDRDRAYWQLGSSGSGNHFVAIGTATAFGESGLAILSHSGSRGFGARVAKHYHTLAQSKHPHLPQGVRNLAWLSLDDPDGREYLAVHDACVRYAHLNHTIIHRAVSEFLGLGERTRIIHSAHNTATLERIHVDGESRQAVVHRKGATPANAGWPGVILGTMLGGTVIVTGLGNTGSLNSASHGSGRVSSRKAAREAYGGTIEDLRAFMLENGVALVDGDVDENPRAYKDPQRVLAAQRDLVRIEGSFQPLAVRMAGPEPRWG